MSFIVAIDGPAGSGKGTITKILSKKLGLVNIGSGSAYRCVAMVVVDKKIDLRKTEEIISILNDIEIEFRNENGNDEIYLNGKNVTKKLMEKDVAKNVSQISSIKEVRFKLNEIFRGYAKDKNVIMEGRDIGTYVFPDADVKIYLDAEPEERAKRRYIQNKELGIEMTYEEILNNIKVRDKNDKEKPIGALKKAEDAVYIDSTNMTIEEVVDEIENIIKKKQGRGK